LLRSCSQESSERIINGTLDEVPAFADGQPQRDDTTLAVMSVQEGLVKRFDAGHTRRNSASVCNRYVVFSSDGTEIYYQGTPGRGEVWSVPTLGGQTRRLVSGTAVAPCCLRI
jgi:hypothetical protein